MQLLVNILLATSVAVATVMIGGLIHGLVTDAFSNGRGMAILVFQLIGGLSSAGSVLFGGVSYALGRKLTPPTTMVGKLGVGIGVLGLITLGTMLAFG